MGTSPFDAGSILIDNVYASILGVVNSLFNQMSAWISSALATVYNTMAVIYGVITDVIKKVGGFLSSALDVIIESVGKVVVAATNTVVYVSANVLGILADLGAIAVKIVATAIIWTDYYISILYDKFKKILEAIHFKTILQIHQILELVSPQYRAMMKKLYAAIGKVSEAVGLGTHFILLALQNSRNLILDLSTSLGGKYDLAQVQWLNTLNNFLKSVAGKVDQWSNDPESVLYDMAQLIDKPAMDAKGTFMADVWITMDNLLKHADSMVNQVNTISTDLYNTIEGLPSFIKDAIPSGLTDSLEAVQNNIATYIEPKLGELSATISKYAEEAKEIKQRIQDAIDNILTPKETIDALGELAPLDKLDVSAKLTDLIADTTWTVAAKVEAESQEILNTMSDTIAQPWPEVPPPEVLTYEPVSLHRHEMVQASEHSSPFVGDF
jgi:phage-related protein